MPLTTRSVSSGNPKRDASCGKVSPVFNLYACHVTIGWFDNSSLAANSSALS